MYNVYFGENLFKFNQFRQDMKKNVSIVSGALNNNYIHSMTDVLSTNGKYCCDWARDAEHFNLLLLL